MQLPAFRCPKAYFRGQLAGLIRSNPQLDFCFLQGIYRPRRGEGETKLQAVCHCCVLVPRRLPPKPRAHGT